MIRNLLMALVAFSCLFSACAQSKKTSTSGDPGPQESSIKSSGLRGLTAATMRRGACFGTCPEYTITIHSDGMAQYSSVRNAEPEGNFEKNIGAKKAHSLLLQFMDSGADTCKDLYEAKISDVPGLYYTFVINGKKKIINNANFGPVFLTTLSQEMDELGKVDSSWTRTEKPKN